MDTDSVARCLYHGVDFVDERHRHRYYLLREFSLTYLRRYEVNPKYIPAFEMAGMRFVGFGDSGLRAEIVELSNHPFFLGTQYGSPLLILFLC